MTKLKSTRISQFLKHIKRKTAIYLEQIGNSNFIKECSLTTKLYYNFKGNPARFRASPPFINPAKYDEEIYCSIVQGMNVKVLFLLDGY